MKESGRQLLPVQLACFWTKPRMMRNLTFIFTLLATVLATRGFAATLPEGLDAVALQISDDLSRWRFKDRDRIAVHRIEVSENLPNVYKFYVEALLLEQVQRRTKLKVVKCEFCRGRVTHELKDRL